MRSGLRGIAVAGLGAAGLVGGHALGYALAVPDPHHRAALAEASGHAYMPSAAWVAAVAGLAALVAGVAWGYLHPGRAPRRGPALALLVPAQAGAFVLLEVFERLASTAGMGTLSPRLLAVGVAVQALVAVLVVLLVGGLRRAGAMGRQSCG